MAFCSKLIGIKGFHFNLSNGYGRLHPSPKNVMNVPPALEIFRHLSILIKTCLVSTLLPVVILFHLQYI